jgi:hypothetical protein
MRGLDKVQAMLKDRPYGAKKVVLPAVSEYLLGNDAHGLRHYPPPKGQKYVRTYKLKRGWDIVSDVYRQRIINDIAYAPHVPNRWAHYGWRQWAQVISDNMDGAMRHANAALNDWLRSKK